MKKRVNHGFTLYELLIVLGIMSLMLLIAAPQVVSSVGSFKQKSLDETARELFLYAENRLAHVDFPDPSPDFYTTESDPLGLIIPGTAGNAVIRLKTGFGAAEAESAYYSEELSVSELLAAAGGERVSGQYGSYISQGSGIMPRGFRLVPTVEVFNGEDLYLKVSCADIPNRPFEDFGVALTLSGNGADYPAQADKIFLENGEIIAYYLLDDGEGLLEKSFPELLKYEKITARAAISCEGFGETSKPASDSASVSFSPLFESVSKEDILVSCARHFNNLSLLSGDFTVRQTADIDGSGGRFPFNPERRAKISLLSSFGGIYDGDGRSISDIELSGSGEVGLFGALGGEVRNLNLINVKISAEAGSNVGAFCGKAEKSAAIVNCSASGVEITAEGGNVGGLAGRLSGRIERSSAETFIRSSGEAAVGGLAGSADGGSIKFSHSMGSVEAEAGVTGGITSGGSGEVFGCYSELSCGYIGEAEFFGVCGEISAESSYFLLENSWLDENSPGALDSAELTAAAIPGFSKTEGFPESVMSKGRPKRFGEQKLADPRGLIGVIKVSEDGAAERLCLFDAYSNEPDFCPGEGLESGYYFVRSRYISDGWSFSSDGGAQLGEEIETERFVFQRIDGLSDGERLTLRFGGETREVIVSLEPPPEQEARYFGAIAVAYYEYISFFDVEKVEFIDGEYYQKKLQLRDSETFLEFNDQTSEYIRVNQFQPDDMSDMEIRIYVVSNLSYDGSWEIIQNFSDIKVNDSVYYYEVYRTTLETIQYRTKIPVDIMYNGKNYGVVFRIEPPSGDPRWDIGTEAPSNQSAP